MFDSGFKTFELFTHFGAANTSDRVWHFLRVFVHFQLKFSLFTDYLSNFSSFAHLWDLVDLVASGSAKFSSPVKKTIFVALPICTFPYLLHRNRLAVTSTTSNVDSEAPISNQPFFRANSVDWSNSGREKFEERVSVWHFCELIGTFLFFRHCALLVLRHRFCLQRTDN
jgi:hypothetical protein